MMEFDTCPHCGKPVLKGAMRCVGCGKILKTPEQQLDSIQKMRESRRSADFGWIIRLILFLAAAGVAYYFFAEEITAFVERFTNR